MAAGYRCAPLIVARRRKRQRCRLHGRKHITTAARHRCGAPPPDGAGWIPVARHRADGRFHEASRLPVADRCEDSGVLGHHIGARVGPLGLPLVLEHPGDRSIFVGFGIAAVEAVSMADVPDPLIEATARNGRPAETDPFLVAALDLGPALFPRGAFRDARRTRPL